MPTAGSFVRSIKSNQIKSNRACNIHQRFAFALIAEQVSGFSRFHTLGRASDVTGGSALTSPVAMEFRKKILA